MNIRQSHAVRIKYIYIYILFPIYYIIYILCMFEQCLLTRYSCPVCVECQWIQDVTQSAARVRKMVGDAPIRKLIFSLASVACEYNAWGAAHLPLQTKNWAGQTCHSTHSFFFIFFFLIKTNTVHTIHIHEQIALLVILETYTQFKSCNLLPSHDGSTKRYDQCYSEYRWPKRISTLQPRSNELSVHARVPTPPLQLKKNKSPYN